MNTPPKLFISYSHDNECLKKWVCDLATRLRCDGVNVILDQWDLNLGSNVARFMETELKSANRILVMCSEEYVRKANNGKGGAGYESQILTANLIENQNKNRVIPIIYSNSSSELMPSFLTSHLYADFRQNENFERVYDTLLRDILGKPENPKPNLGANPFETKHETKDPIVSFTSAEYVSKASSGTVTFDYSNNNGRYVLGSGEMLFETQWSGADQSSIYAYCDPTSIRSVALAININEITEITDASIFNTSSRVRRPKLNEIIIWQNTSGYYLATKVKKLACRSREAKADSVTFTYKIQSNKERNFSTN